MNKASILILFLTLFAASTSWSKSATEIFESASLSVVVVLKMDASKKIIGLGSGVVIGSEEVVTNCHVIEKAFALAVKIGERRHAAKIKHADWARDVCSLEVSGLNAPAVALGSTKKLKVGQRVFAIGAPQGLELTLSEGIVSSLREVSDARYLQITTPISQGSSGGGLLDEEGQLIGLPTFYLSEGQQLNFAVPVEWIMALPQRNINAMRSSRSLGEWLTKTIDLENRKNWRGLLEHARDWTRSQPGESTAWFSLGLAYHQTGQNEEALSAYREALRIDPKNANTWNNIGIIFRETGQQENAIEAYQQALRIDPMYLDAWYNLGIVYRRIGSIANAIEAHQQALRINPQFASAWNGLGSAYDDFGQITKAIEAYLEALRINPKYDHAWINLGIAYGKSGNNTQAIEAFKQALLINPKDRLAWSSLGLSYSENGQTAKAIEAYQQALHIDPKYALAWYGLGFTYKKAGQRSRVIEIYQRLKHLDPKLAEDYFRTAVSP